MVDVSAGIRTLYLLITSLHGYCYATLLCVPIMKYTGVLIKMQDTYFETLYDVR
jgi:hypothetical protein